MISDDRIDIRDLVAQLCERLEIPYDYVAELTLIPGRIDARILVGSEGRGKGAIHLGEDGNVVTEEVSIKVYS